jgi:GPH family glycoside/pentoside/hexuronide:cation symporter
MMKRRTLIGWSVGSFSTSVLVNAVALLHLRFMTDSLGLSMGLAGSLVVLARIYDTFLDPIVGVISDRTRGRFNGYRPYLIVGGLLAALSMVILFNVPSALTGYGVVAFAAFSLLFFSTAYTLVRIPYLAIGRALTQDFKERSKLMAGSVYGSAIGGLLATAAAPYLLARMGDDRAGHGTIALILAAFIALGSISTYLLIGAAGDEQKAHTPKIAVSHTSVREMWRALRENQPFQWLIAFKIITFTGMAVHVTAMPYYTRHVLRSSDVSLSSVFLMTTLAMMASQLLWVPLAARYGRRNALLAAGLVDVLALFCWSLIPVGHPSPWLQMCGALDGLAGGGMFLGLYTVLTDTMDITRNRHGDSGREGILAGVFVMVEKGTGAVGIFLFTSILAWSGYLASRDVSTIQPASVNVALNLSISFIPAIFTLIGCLCLYKLNLREAPAPIPPALEPTTA